MKDPLLILHGALGSQSQFAEWKKSLSSKFDCHTFDFAGHGSRSAEGAKFSIGFFAEELAGYIRSSKWVRPHVLGYSMGGYVALCAAMQEEDLLGNIMTLATKFDWNLESSKKEAGYLKPELMLQKVPQLAQQLKDRHGDHWEMVVRRTAEMMLALGMNPLLTKENINQVKNKIKFCVGDKDKMVGVEETLAMYRVAAHANFCVLPATGHLPETMNLDRIIFEVEEFFLSPGTPQASRG